MYLNWNSKPRDRWNEKRHGTCFFFGFGQKFLHFTEISHETRYLESQFFGFALIQAYLWSCYNTIISDHRKRKRLNTRIHLKETTHFLWHATECLALTFFLFHQKGVCLAQRRKAHEILNKYSIRSIEQDWKARETSVVLWGRACGELVGRTSHPVRCNSDYLIFILGYLKLELGLKSY